MKKKTIYKTTDRQGVKYFSEKPSFNCGFDYFSGKQIDAPKNFKRFRVIKKFTAKVIGGLSKLYPSTIKIV